MLRSLVPIVLSLIGCVSSHGAMQYPPTWFDSLKGNCGLNPGCFDGGVMWFSNDTSIPGEPTIADDSYLRTYHGEASYPGSPGDMSHNPWRAPGSAAIFSPCGVDGGNPQGCPIGDINSKGEPCPGGGSGYGPSAVDVKSLVDTPWTTEWKAGSVVEAAWGIKANHGGGYSYRLCRRDMNKSSSNYGLTEECFQKTPLMFSGDMQWVQFNNSAQRVAFVANSTTKGTIPRGSMWRKNPIPACNSAGGGGMQPTGTDCNFVGTQFPSPALNLNTGKPLQGFCESARNGYMTADCQFAIVDRLQVPASLQPGNWVLSFRWDCEQTSQVWSTCANVKVT